MLLAVAILIALYVGFTMSRPQRPGEYIPTFVWVILFCANIFIASLLLPVTVIPVGIPQINGVPITVYFVPLLGLIAGPVLSWLILRSRREASEIDPYMSRMDARRERVEKAKREGRP